MQSGSFLERRAGLAAGAIILLTTAVRLWFVASNQLDLVQDEAQYWDWTRHLQLSYYSKGPLVAWIISFWTHLLGDTPMAVRLGAVAGSCLAQVVLFLGVSRVLKEPALGLWTLVVANTTPLFMASGVLMTTDNPLLVCWVGAMFCLYRGCASSGSRVPFLLLALCMALGILAKYMMLAFWGTALIFAAGLKAKGLLPKGCMRRLLWSLTLGTAVGFAPILAWNAGNDWVGFRHVATLAAKGKPGAWIRFDRFPEYMGSQVGLLAPWWFVFMLVGAWRALRRAFAPVVLGSAQAVFAGEAEEVRRAWLLAAAFWPVWGFFLVWSFHKKIYPNWSAVSYASGLVLAAWAFSSLREGFWRRFKPLWLGLGLAGFLLLHGQNWLPLPDHLNPALRLKGFADLGRRIEQLCAESFADPHRVFYFSDSYTMTAALAFYAPGRPRAYNAYFGRRMSQYDLWPGPEDKEGWDAVYVGKDFVEVPREVDDMCHSVETIHYQATHRGKPARKFTIGLCHGFTGKWPSFTGEDY